MEQSNNDSLVSCAGCGARLPRAEMFGVVDDLRCPQCARRARSKYNPPAPRLAQRAAPITWLVMVLAILATLLSRSGIPQGQLLLATVSPLAQGEVWRLFTTVFVHADLLHIVFNLYFLWQFGRALEMWAGSARYTGFLLLVIIGSSAATVLYTPIPSVGLSGVLYAMFGMLLAMRHEKDFAAEQMQPQVVQWMLIWLAVCLFLPGISNAAHFSGFALGWVIGQAILQPQRKLLLAVLAVAVVVLAAGAVVAARQHVRKGLLMMQRMEALMPRDMFFPAAEELNPDEGAWVFGPAGMKLPPKPEPSVGEKK